MDVVFGLWADGPTYPAHGGVGAGASGSPVVGPLGMLDILETALGLSGPAQPQVVRIAAWQGKLEAADTGARFWHASLAADPWATARLLLSWRDALIEAGWRPAVAVSPRISDIAAAEEIGAALPPGPADRLAALSRALDARAGRCVQRVRLIDARSELSPGWRRLIAALEGLGVVIEAVAPRAAADPNCSLGRAQHWITEGVHQEVGPDGGLVEILADTPMMAAEALAGWLASRPEGAGSTVLVAQDGDSQLLDGILARHAQPRAGLSPRSPFRGALQVLPLAFQLAWPPFDAQALMDLLLLPRPPLPRAVARRIATVLAEAPGLDGPAWRDLWREIEEEARAAAETDAEQKAVTVRLERWQAWVRPSSLDASGGLSLVQVLAICTRVAEWAMAQYSATGDPYFLSARRLAEAVSEAVRSLARTSYSPTLLDRIIDQALADGESDPTAQAEAAPWRAVAHPGAIWSEASTVVWWNFVDTGERPPRTPWTQHERTALADAGCEPDGDADAARRLAAAWERPVLNAGEQLVVVRASLSQGAATAPHPLAHRLAPVLRTEAQHSRAEPLFRRSQVVLAGVNLERTPLDRRVLPAAVMRWDVPPRFAELVGARVESATAFEDLLACQFSWALKHVARLRPGRARSIPDANQLLGLLAHALATELLPSGAPPEPDAVAAAAEARLDTLVDEMAAPLRTSAAAADFVFARRRLPASIAALARSLRENGLTVEAMEVPVEGRFADTLPVRGAIDLLARTPTGAPVIVDLKWTRSDNVRRREIEAGLAVQLATYVALVDPSLTAEAGYFLLNQRELVAPTGGQLRGRTVASVRSLADTWRAVLESWTLWRGHTADNGLLALGVTGAAELAPQGLSLVRDVRCDRCDYATLCRVNASGAAA